MILSLETATIVDYFFAIDKMFTCGKSLKYSCKEVDFHRPISVKKKKQELQIATSTLYVMSCGKIKLS